MRVGGSTRPAECYEAILIEKGCDPFAAKAAVHVILNIGFRWVFPEHEAARALGRVLRKLKVSKQGSLANSRRARELLGQTSSALGKKVLSDAIAKSRLKMGIDEIIQIAEAAANRADEAMKELQGIAGILSQYVLDPRGRPISRTTSFHAYLLLLLHHLGKPSLYSRGNGIETTDYFDSATRATRKAWNQPNFDPRGAVLLVKERLRHETAPWLHAAINSHLNFAPVRRPASRDEMRPAVGAK